MASLISGDYSLESESESSPINDDAAAMSDTGAGAREGDGINDENESVASSAKDEGGGVEDDDDGGGSADSGEDVDGGDGSKTYDEGDAVDGGGGIVDGSNDESARDDGDADDAAKKKMPVDFAKWGCLGQVSSVVRKVSLEKPPVKFAKAPSRAGLTAPRGTKLGFAKPITSVPPQLPH